MTDPEAAILGALLTSPETIPQAQAVLVAEDFVKAHHQKLYAAIVRVYERDGTVDPVSISACFNGKGSAVSVYIGELIAGLPRVQSLEPWVRQVKAEAVRRHAEALIESIGTKLQDHEADPYEILAELSRESVGLARSGKRSDWLQSDVLAKDALRHIETRLNAPEGLIGLPTGLLELDRKLQGMRPGQLIGIGGRPGSGKTSLCQQIAKHCASLGYSVGFFSLEMTALEVTEREIGSDARVNLSTLYLSKGAEREENMSALARAAGRAMTQKLHKVEGSFTVEEIEGLAVSASQRWGLDVVAIDYLQLIQTPRGIRRHEALADVSRALKAMAMRLKLPVIVALQLNRAPEQRSDRRPSLSDIAETDAPAKDCHSLILIHQNNDRESVELCVEKNRSGFSGVARCVFEPAFTRFRDE